MTSVERRPAWRMSVIALARAVLVIAFVGCSADSKPPTEVIPVDEPPPVVMPGVYELRGIDPKLKTGDLAPFRTIVGEARFVALGESTHTSAGFYQAKVRLIRYMIEQMGFRVLAFETPWLQGLGVSQYVASCTGGVENAMAGMFRVWQDTNVRDLLIWLCEYNRAHPTDPVTFYGFDIQEPWKNAPALEKFITSAAPAELGRMQLIRRCLGATAASDQWFLSQEWRDHRDGNRNVAAHEDCIRGITETETWISANGAALQAVSSVAAVEEARLYLVGLRAM
ncbi:MAG TPA: erythromycin esterase family protein, partial [Gemmatimonadaceae bacterium]|nr:erythromycin esterase family protein [Gemmatimonadaceae bacterium]